MMGYWVYMLECCDGSFYTGYTSNLEGRLEQHNLGRGSRYVRSRLPARLVYSERHFSRKDAMRREREIKKLSRKEKEHMVRL